MADPGYEHVKNSLWVWFDQNWKQVVGDGGKDDFEQLLACIDRSWQMAKDELFLVERTLNDEFKRGNEITPLTAIQLLTFVRLCSERNSIPDRVERFRKKMQEDQQKDER